MSGSLLIRLGCALQNVWFRLLDVSRRLGGRPARQKQTPGPLKPQTVEKLQQLLREHPDAASDLRGMMRNLACEQAGLCYNAGQLGWRSPAKELLEEMLVSLRLSEFGYEERYGHTEIGGDPVFPFEGMERRATETVRAAYDLFHDEDRPKYGADTYASRCRDQVRRIILETETPR